MKMKQVMSHNINNGLLNIIRRTDPMITQIQSAHAKHVNHCNLRLVW